LDYISINAYLYLTTPGVSTEMGTPQDSHHTNACNN